MEEYRFDHLSHPAAGSRQTTRQREYSSANSRLHNTNTSNVNNSNTNSSNGNYSVSSSLAVIPNSPGLSSIASNPTDRPPLPPHNSTGSILNSTNTSIHQISASNHQQYEEIQDKQRLEKQNFELKMKIYHLEDAIHSLQEKEIQRQSANSQHNSELNDLRLQLEERNLELEERNLLLLKAKNAMEILKAELHRSQLDGAKQAELQEKIASLKRMNDEIERDYKQQVSSYEQEVKSAKHVVNLKQQEISVLEDQIKQLEVAVEKEKEDYKQLQNEKDKTETIWISAQERISLLEEEVTQCHAHIDLYKLRVQEEQEEKHHLQTQLKELVAKKATQEEDHRHRLQEVNQQYELQIRSMRSTHEQEMEKVRGEHLQMMSDIRENYHKETNRMKAMYDQELQDLKLVETNEKTRQREDLMDRLSEKNEEIKAIKAQLDAQQQRYERLAQDAEAFKMEIKEKQHYIDNTKFELQSKSEEINHLQSLKATIHSLQQKIIEMQEFQQKENIEKLQLSFQRETLSHQVLQLQQEYKQLEEQKHNLEIENSKLSFATTDLSAKNEAIDSFSKEMDKHRIIQRNLSNEVIEGKLKYEHLAKEKDSLQQEYQRALLQHKSLQDDVKQAQTLIDNLQSSLQQEKENLRKEQEKRMIAESLLQEIRNNYSSLKLEYEEAKNQQVQENQEALEETEHWKQQMNDWIGIYLMMLHALREWEEELGVFVEGETTSGLQISSNFNFPPQQQYTSVQGNSLANWLSSQQQQQQSFNSRIATPKKQQHSRSSGRLSSSNGMPPISASKGRAQSPTSSRRGNYLQSMLSAAAYNEYEYYSNVFATRIQDAKHEMGVAIERMAIKQDKIRTMRSIFQQDYQRILQQFQQFTEKISSTLSQYQEQINHLSSEVLHCQKVISHDQQVLQQERQDFQSLKEVLLREQQDKYHQLEVKYTESLMKLESSQRQDENHQKQLQQVLAENKELHQSILHYKKDRQVIQQLEDGIEQFNLKYESIQKQYHSLEQENHRKDQNVQQLNTEKSGWQQERHALHLEHDRLKMQLNLLKERVQDSERQYQLALLEIERLQSRPIDAELALKLLSLHQRETAGKGTDSTAVSSPPSNGSYSNAKNMHDLIERLSPLRSSRSENTHFASSSARNRAAESVYFPSRRGLMAAATERFDAVEETANTTQTISSSGLPSRPYNTHPSSTSTTAVYTTSIHSEIAAQSLGASLTNSTSRLSNIDRSLQALAKKLDSFEKPSK